MANLEFDSNAFTEKIMTAITREMAAIDHIVHTKRNIQDERADNDQARKELPGEISKMEDAAFHVKSIQEYDEYAKKLKNLKDKRSELISYSGRLTNKEITCDNDFGPARDRLIHGFKNAVGSYSTTKRTQAVREIIENLLEEDQAFYQAVKELYDKIFYETGIKNYHLGFPFESFMSGLNMSDNQKKILKTIHREFSG